MSTTTTAPETTGTTSAAAASLPRLLVDHARRTPTASAMRKKQLGRWKSYTWADYATRVASVAGGLRSLGVTEGDRVAIQAENRPAWVIIDLAIQSLGAISVGIYPTSPATELHYLLEQSGAVVLIAENEEQFDKVEEVRLRLPQLRTVVVVDPRGIPIDAGTAPDGGSGALISLADLERRGAAATLESLERDIAKVTAEHTAMIVYTSGTTGPPKGAMLTHANLLSAAFVASSPLGLTARDEVISYLSLCHIAERMLSLVDALAYGYVVNFGEGTDSFLSDLQQVQPTFFFGVPRVWEKLMAGVEFRVANASFVKRKTFAFWRRRGAALAARRRQGHLGILGRVQYAIGWVVLYRSVRKKLGLLRVRLALSGAAPIAPEVLEWFWSIGVPVLEAYGQTENSALATCTPAGNVRLGRVGRAVPGAEVRLADDGEILTRGAGTFAGYYNDPDGTRAAIEPDGWLHTGDLGSIDEDGFVTITDRKKDIIVTADGISISPSPIENQLKVSPFVREAIVIGHGRRYLTALIGIEGDTVGNWARQHNLGFITYGDLASKPEVHELIDGYVEKVNTGLSQIETVERFRLLPKELDQEDGEVTATQKVRRATITEEFAGLIDSMYVEGPEPASGAQRADA